MPEPASTAELNQKQYADRVGVTPSRISRATKEGGVVQGKYVSAQDAVVRESDGKLLGCQEPVEWDVSPGDASSKSARKAAGITLGEERNQHGMGNRENGRARRTLRPEAARRTKAKTAAAPREVAASKRLSKKPGRLPGLRLLEARGSSAACSVSGKPLLVSSSRQSLWGARRGRFSGAEPLGSESPSTPSEQTRPQEPTRQIRPKGLRRPVRHGLLPGMSQDEGGQKQRGQFSVGKERLARGRPVETRAASHRAGSGHK